MFKQILFWTNRCVGTNIEKRKTRKLHWSKLYACYGSNCFHLAQLCIRSLAIYMSLVTCESPCNDGLYPVHFVQSFIHCVSYLFYHKYMCRLRHNWPECYNVPGNVTSTVNIFIKHFILKLNVNIVFCHSTRGRISLYRWPTLSTLLTWIQ